MPKKTQKLSASLEDYLEAIYNLCARDNVVRSRDIAKDLQVSKASVTSALKTLASKELVNYEPYGYITLTEQGMTLAAQVASKHDTIATFFVDILGVDQDRASKAACKAEHTLGAEIVDKLLDFIEFVGQNNANGYDLASEFKKFCQPSGASVTAISPWNDVEKKKHLIPLSMVSPGQSVTLNNIDFHEVLKSRLAALGMVPGTLITVLKTDRPGPFIVNVKGSKIALGRPMTHKIMVKPVEK